MRHRWMYIISLIVLLTFVLGVMPIGAAPPASVMVHVVQRGETLYSIARHYGVDVWDIARANGIINPNRIYVGQRLTIPSGQPSGSVHVVRVGETLYGIALRYGVDAWTIARANGISNLNHIYVGQRLTIPGYTPPKPKPTPQPQPQPITWPGPWTGAYFDNVSLSGSPYTERIDDDINFDWAYGPPAGGMPTNAFSVRWTGTFPMEAGTYRFYAKVDDGVRVYIDDALVINGWRDGGLRTYSKDRALAAGEHTIKVEYYDRVQVARIYFWWKKISGPTPTPGPTPTATPKPGETPEAAAGWHGEYFNNQELSGDPVAAADYAYIGFDWQADSPMPAVWADHFSARYTTQVYLETDHYRFCTMSDDGTRIWVEDELVLDEWHGNNGIAYCGVYHATPGTYDVTVEYYEDGGNALLYVWWEPH